MSKKMKVCREAALAKAIRIEKRMTQAELGAAIGRTQERVSAWETGKSQPKPEDKKLLEGFIKENKSTDQIGFKWPQDDEVAQGAIEAIAADETCADLRMLVICPDCGTPVETYKIDVWKGRTITVEGYCGDCRVRFTKDYDYGKEVE